VLTTAGHHDEALASYRKDLAITGALAAADPGNIPWQRDLSISYERIGTALAGAGRRTEALAAFRE